jgi:hypothetical protein
MGPEVREMSEKEVLDRLESELKVSLRRAREIVKRDLEDGSRSPDGTSWADFDAGIVRGLMTAQEILKRLRGV